MQYCWDFSYCAFPSHQNALENLCHHGIVPSRATGCTGQCRANSSTVLRHAGNAASLQLAWQPDCMAPSFVSDQAIS